MKFLKTFGLSVFLVALFLCGCSQSNEDEVRKAKRFEALKGLPLDTVLTRAFKFYERFQATGDTLLRDSMNDYRDHFFARWELSSDSLCGTVAPDDSLAADLREIYKVVMTFDIKSRWYSVGSLQNTLYQIKKNRKPIDFSDVLADLLRMRENLDSVRAVQNQRDSIWSAEIWAISHEDAISGLKKDSNNLFNRIYFVQTMQVLYVDTSASDMNELDKIDRHRIKRNAWKETKSACLNKTPMGQQVLVLNKEYESLLNNFMKANVHESRRERYTLKSEKYTFWHPMISVVPHHSGDGFHFESFPAMGRALFNKNHDMVILSVEESFNSGSYYYLAKKNGKWKLVMHKSGWVA